MINVLLADNDTMLLDGLSSILRQHEDIQLIATASSGREVTNHKALAEVDVAILDIQMGPMDGLEAAAFLKGKYPQIKILMLSLHKNRDMVRKVQELKLDGYVLKEKGRDELIDAIHYVMKGKKHRWFGREITEVLLNSIDEDTEKEERKAQLRFSQREIDVLKLLAQGLAAKEIANRLSISRHTVETYKQTMMEKSGAKNGPELIHIAYQHEILTKEPED